MSLCGFVQCYWPGLTPTFLYLSRFRLFSRSLIVNEGTRTPQCPQLYFNLFATCREPGDPFDRIRHYSPEESRHVVVVHNSQVSFLKTDYNYWWHNLSEQTHQMNQVDIVCLWTEGKCTGCSEGRMPWMKWRTLSTFEIILSQTWTRRWQTSPWQVMPVLKRSTPSVECQLKKSPLLFLFTVKSLLAQSSI